MNFTNEQKKEYFAKLRESWKSNKAQAENDKDAKEKYEAIRRESPNFTISYFGFFFALQAMKSAGLDGTPYIDAKTFKGWQAAGYKVNKGEKSLCKGLTWISTKKNDDDDDGMVYPKEYALFHRSQVIEI